MMLMSSSLNGIYSSCQKRWRVRLWIQDSLHIKRGILVYDFMKGHKLYKARGWMLLMSNN